LPKILFLVAFLLLLSFWVDLCHQANDEDKDEGFPREPLLEKVNKANLKVRSRRRCYSANICDNAGISCAYMDWPGKESNILISCTDTFAVAMLLLGGALCPELAPEPLCNSCQVNVLSNFL
ncbi:tobamovirus multiplication protein 1-like protein, partial [Tanacetum coccineum]